MSSNTIEIRLVGNPGNLPGTPNPSPSPTPPPPSGLGSPPPVPRPGPTNNPNPQQPSGAGPNTYPPLPPAPTPANAAPQPSGLGSPPPPLPFPKPQASPINPTPQPSGLGSPQPTQPTGNTGNNGTPPTQPTPHLSPGAKNASSSFDLKVANLINGLESGFKKLLGTVLSVGLGLNLFRQGLGVINQDIALGHKKDLEEIGGDQLAAKHTQSQRGYKAVSGVLKTIPILGDLAGGIVDEIGEFFTSGQKRFNDRMEAFDKIIDRAARYSPDVSAERAKSQTTQVGLNLLESQRLGPELAELERVKREINTINALLTMNQNVSKLNEQIAESKEQSAQQLAALKAQIATMQKVGQKVDAQTLKLVDQLEKGQKTELETSAFYQLALRGGFKIIDTGNPQPNLPSIPPLLNIPILLNYQDED